MGVGSPTTAWTTCQGPHSRRKLTFPTQQPSATNNPSAKRGFS